MLEMSYWCVYSGTSWAADANVPQRKVEPVFLVKNESPRVLLKLPKALFSN